MSFSSFPRAALDFVSKAIWNIPGRFQLANVLGRSYSLRCVVFHHIAAADSPFTAGTNVRATPREFEDALKFLTAHYHPVCLEDVLADPDGSGLPERALLVTFDDAYASVPEVAAPLCRKYRVPAAFFVNAAFLDNHRLAPDNLICYVANKFGMEVIDAAARTLRTGHSQRSNLRSLSETFTSFLPAITLSQRQAFLDELARLTGIDESDLAAKSGLYMTSAQLRALSSYDFEIGNHTFSHVHGRSLTPDDFTGEIDRNKAELESISGAKVRAFSLPYGSSKDLTPELAGHLRRSGHQAVFFSESVSNRRGSDRRHFDRVNCRPRDVRTLFVDIEVLPRLRAIRDRIAGPAAMRRSSATVGVAR